MPLNIRLSTTLRVSNTGIDITARVNGTRPKLSERDEMRGLVLLNVLMTNVDNNENRLLVIM